ncbi:MAG: hypothetical protein DVB31_15865 [Verrucomicrobia bacterium]|nr:MAG: hypothetical protein DVB31_15865 [Verrucomicrobiota bacterium]
MSHIYWRTLRGLTSELLRGLDHRTEATPPFRDRRYASRAEPTGQTEIALRAAGVALPQTLMEPTTIESDQCSASGEA